MLKKGFYKYYTELPPWGKGVAIIGIGAAAYFLFQKINATATNVKKNADAKKSLSEVTDDISELNKNGVKPSYTDSQYRSWADSLFTCFEGFGTCFGYMTIFQNMKNDADVLKLIQAYGVRTIPSGKFNPMPDFRGTLPQALRDEVQTINIWGINQILKNRGITYKF